MATFLYIVGYQGSVKIGFAGNIKNRISALQTASPNKIECYACFSVADHIRHLERSIHHALRDKRISGEWFTVAPDEAIATVVRVSSLIRVEIARVPNVEIENNHGIVGRPSVGKQVLTIRLDPDLLAHYRATGKGWQSRMNDDLRRVSGLPPR